MKTERKESGGDDLVKRRSDIFESGCDCSSINGNVNGNRIEIERFLVGCDDNFLFFFTA